MLTKVPLSVVLQNFNCTLAYNEDKVLPPLPGEDVFETFLPGQREYADRTIYVNYIPEKFTLEDILTLFGPYGDIEGIVVRPTDNERVFIFVTYQNEEMKLNALHADIRIGSYAPDIGYCWSKLAVEVNLLAPRNRMSLDSQ
ncbi:hypothetical protein HDE_05938 [Halotydeus destructor]|nr:hypothetical protein HDE_05938 [Halotydeus destructor]